MNEYHPVSCELHSQYELYIIQHKKVKLDWHDEDGSPRQARLLLQDIVTRNHEEFLIGVDDDGQEFSIRLDYVRSVTPV
jgi:Rho-binding antiterminator